MTTHTKTDGLGEDQPSALYKFGTDQVNTGNEDDLGGEDSYYCSEGFRSVFVASGAVSVVEYESILQLQRRLCQTPFKG